MRITALSGGVGGARFLRGLIAHLDENPPPDGPTVTLRNPDPVTLGNPTAESEAVTEAPVKSPDHCGLDKHHVTVVGNTGDDITLHGLRVCPDLDSVLYTLGGGSHEEQGWGRADETYTVAQELAAYGAQPTWFGLGDRDLATHVHRTHLLARGLSLSEVTARLALRWGLPERGVTLLPMTESPVETHVVVDDPDAAGGRTAIHFQEWWIRHRGALPAHGFPVAGLAAAAPAPGVLDAIRTADVVLLPPSNPVVSIGIVLGVPGVRDALRGTTAPVVGISPVVAGAPVRGHADACLSALGIETSADAVAGLYADFLDGWLVDPSDAEAARRLRARGLAVVERPLLMTSVAQTAAMASDALALASSLR